VDEDAARDELARYVVRSMGDPAAVLAVGETGFLKKGRMSAGEACMYTGTAGRVENCQAGVFAAYVAPDGGRALIDRELYLPEEWANDRGPVPGRRDRRRRGVRDEARAGAEDDRPRAGRLGPVLLGGWRRGLRRQPGAPLVA
jgi:DDE superfamily endonuclease